MGGNGKNGNATKGNKIKKSRRKVDPVVELEEGDCYGKIHKLCGENIVYVELVTPNEDGDKTVKARISGKMYKKVWFKPDNLVILGGRFSDKIYDLKGMVKKNEESKVRQLFDGKDNDEDIRVHIGDEIDDIDEDYDDTFLGVQNKKGNKNNNKNNKNNTGKDSSDKNKNEKNVMDIGSSESGSVDIDDL
jgi:translation initiation factor IF-1